MRQQSRAHAAQLKTFGPVRCCGCNPPSSRTGPARGAVTSSYLHLGKPHPQYASHRAPQRHPQNWKPPASQLWSAAKARVAILSVTRGWRESTEEGNQGAAGPRTPGSASPCSQAALPRAAGRAAEKMPHRQAPSPASEGADPNFQKTDPVRSNAKEVWAVGHRCVSNNNWSLLS